MYNNNFNNNYGYLGGMQPGGYSYNQNMNPPKYTQPLTKEQIDMLRKHKDTFSLGLTQEEVLRGICFHRDVNGQETLRPNNDGTVTCTICGRTFDPIQDMSEEGAKEIVQEFVDLLQTVKLLYLDMPAEAAAEFFQIIPLAEKVPKLFKIAADNFSKHENWNSWRYNGSPNTVNLYNMLSGGGVNVGMYGQQPPQGGMSGQPPMGAPTFNNGGFNTGMPMMGQPPMPGSNGMGYMGAVPTPQVGYQPTTQGYQYNAPVGAAPVPPQPQVQMPTAAPAQPATPGNNVPATTTTTTDGKSVKVDATFKA